MALAVLVALPLTGSIGWALVGGGLAGAAPGIGPAEADAIGALIGLGEARLAPLTDGRAVFGVLTVWAPTLGRGDRAVAGILGRLAGGAVSAQRARDAAWSGRLVPGPEARRPGARAPAA